jgi:hypothetical protein
MKTTKKKTKSTRTKKKGGTRKSYSFRFILAGASELTQELEDALFEAGCGDALLGLCDGVLLLIFDREAPSFRIALTSAIADVERAGVGLELVRVEPA